MIICILGRSGSGKSTLKKKFLNIGYRNYKTYTTRPKRDKDDNDYIHVDKMPKDIKFKQSFNTYLQHEPVEYGFPIILDYKIHNYVCICTPEIFKQMCNFYGKDYCTGIYIEVNEKILRQRLIKRGDDIKEINRRLNSDFKDFVNFPDFHNTKCKILEILG